MAEPMHVMFLQQYWRFIALNACPKPTSRMTFELVKGARLEYFQ